MLLCPEELDTLPDVLFSFFTITQIYFEREKQRNLLETSDHLLSIFISILCKHLFEYALCAKCVNFLDM